MTDHATVFTNTFSTDTVSHILRILLHGVSFSSNLIVLYTGGNRAPNEI